MIKIIQYPKEKQELENRILRNHAPNKEVKKIVEEILENVRLNGDKALIEYCNKFDGASFFSSEELLVSKKEIVGAYNRIDGDLRNALKLAKDRITCYHEFLMPENLNFIDKTNTRLGNVWMPIESIGVYVPGGTAFYPSSVLMNVVPALVAGSKEISIASPSKNGVMDDSILAAAHICGIERIYKIGGAGAIAALAYGTGIVSKVDKIVGPGNEFVAIAKKMLYGVVGIDMVAGPTDVLIIADTENKPNWVAIDMLAQAEHGEDSAAILITDDEAFAEAVSFEIERILLQLDRVNIVRKAIDGKSMIILVDDLYKDAPEIANKIAPEHLQISVRDNDTIFKQIRNAGAVFLGEYSPEAMGDYIVGPSHTLPTGGNARFSSGLSVFDFLKRMSVMELSELSMSKLGEFACRIAKSEALTAHELSIRARE